jgi:glycosyltransferase involved in cell wall biosynthesis
LGEKDDVLEILQGVDIATLTSAFGEGFPNALGEAMACALPCVTTDVGDSAAIVADTGIVVPPRNARQLAAGWRQMFELSSEARLELGTRARKRVAENWSLPAIVRAYEAAYTTLVC